ncbi:MAG: efflux RND transporter permease subunit [Gammaproteobacteria bacterium]|nr:efflux RND transporter permease subunit [Gammaproteobacteria bacterium]MBU1653955.1 efflux RND transporter permease subunit [Gammaproteobacteria bacterium]MBU1960159.1 efflux RND transporter permease subunit [Gammaproteobacteria bacterium]
MSNSQGGIAAWSVGHPVGVVMITLALSVLGLFALERLGVDLLPQIIYPEVRVRVNDPGVPASIMEDQVTRQLEEQLAITEDAVSIQSTTTEGSSSVDLSFQYGKDIDIALRDASTRLDRAKRFLPDSIDPPTIYKRDPSQAPAVEYVVASSLLGPVEVRDWTDYSLGKWLLNLPGVAAAEVGGGLVREVEIRADQLRLAGLGLDIDNLATQIVQANRETPAGRLQLGAGEISGRTAGRFESLDELRHLPIPVAGATLPLGELTEIIDGAEEERVRIRLNGEPGVKLSIQKQPRANTVAVVDSVERQMAELQAKGLVPREISIHPVDDQASYVRQSLRNAVLAAVGGALLAMLTVYLFLGDLRRTLIIGSAIPVAILVTFILMAAGGLTLNIMTLGGLALGVGMLVDSAIVMLENIQRHQREGDPDAARRGAAEVNSAIIASTTTNLAAVLPFLFIGGLVGLLFRELIFTISASIVAAMLIALTLTPALAGRIGRENDDNPLRRAIDGGIGRLQAAYGRLLEWVLGRPWRVIALFVAGLLVALPRFDNAREVFLPDMDEGRVTISLRADRGINLETMDNITRRVEKLLAEQPETDSLFTLVGGRVYGRSQYESANEASIKVRLKPLAGRGGIGSKAWMGRIQKAIDKLGMAGVRVSLRTPGIRGIRLSQGDDDLSLRIQGTDLDRLESLADQVAERLGRIAGLANVEHSAEEHSLELAVRVDRERAARYGLDVTSIGKAVRFALDGSLITDYLEKDRSLDVRLRLDRRDVSNPEELNDLVLFSRTAPRVPVRLGELARVELVTTPATIRRDRQQRIVEIGATLTGERPLGEVYKEVKSLIAETPLPPGYTLYEAGNIESLQAGRRTGQALLGLALFLVFAVMAVQYESVRNPLVIILGVPFALTGVAAGLLISGLPLSMPVWLGLIMLAGILVNNAIVLVEYIEILRRRGMEKGRAIIEGARLRLRPILMATLTTLVGMLPLALALGEGSEMLQPLAVTIVSGLSFSLLVSLLLIPVIYGVLGKKG